MFQRLRVCLVGLIAIAAVSSLAEDIHIILRPKGGKTSFHLGEPITTEAVCVSRETNLYLTPCRVVLMAEPSPGDGRLSADRIDQLTWLDAMNGSLPPGPRGECGNIDNPLPSQGSRLPSWQDVTLGNPSPVEQKFPVAIGRYKVTAKLAFDLEVGNRFGDPANHASSDELDISLDDELGWKDHLIRFRGCDYEVRLVLIPDRDVIDGLSHHLGDCAVELDETSFPTLLHEIVWLTMQVERPHLYSRMVELEHGQTAEPGETLEIRQWFHAQYRTLLLQAARQLILAYKKHPELHSDEYFIDDVWTGFGNWHDTAASLEGNARSYLGAEEVSGFLREAGFSPKHIALFFKEHRSHLPQETPEYHQQ